MEKACHARARGTAHQTRPKVRRQKGRRGTDNVATATDAPWGGEGHGAAMLQYHHTSHKFLYSARVISSALAQQKFLRAMMYFWFCISSR
jgi:hypothetical protein